MAVRSSTRRRSSGVQLGELIAPAMILQGAARVFAQLGVRETSVAHILKAANVSRRTFYRHFKSKEEVMVALYKLGTDRLIEGCRAAFKQQSEPIRQIEHCIDVHLRNAKELGRLVFVLGGEAQRRESDLHPRRMEVHETLVSFFAAAAPVVRGKHIDPLLFRAVIIAVEGLVRVMLDEADEGRRVTDAAIESTRRALMRLAAAALIEGVEGVPPVPMVD